MITPDLRLGRWESVLADVECDALICDPPFGERTHAAWREGSEVTEKLKRGPIAYTHWTPDDVAVFVARWAPRTHGGMVALTSHDLQPAWEAAYEEAGRYAFQPLPCVVVGGSIRLAGDGPSNWSCYAMVARPRRAPYSKWGTLPGAYLAKVPPSWARGSGGGRGKPIDLMRALVKDYSRPGDLVCDPCAGYGTTGLAALSMGRRFVGAECDEAAFAEAQKRLARPTTGDLIERIV